MRSLILLSLALVTGCAPASNKSTNNITNGVDINAAAEAARGDIDSYAANNIEEAAQPVQAPTPAASLAPLTPPAPGTPGGLPDDRTPVSEAPFTPDSAQGAANVVQTYYALLEEGKYRQAWGLWEDGGKASGMSAEAFAASFAKYTEYHANIGAPGRVDAGAGQRFVTVPVQVYGRLKQGAAPVYMIGSMVLHRTADIDGATAEQKRWHIRSADIKPRPGQAPAADSGLPATADAAYRCIDGSRIAVHFDNRADSATVRDGAKVLAVLHGQRPASGIWYKGGGYELRGKGKQATFTKPRLPPLACTAR